MDTLSGDFAGEDAPRTTSARRSYACTKTAESTAFNTPPGVGYNSSLDGEAWCREEWCYVDPCTCDAKDIAYSSWLPGGGYYSYAVCGGEDSFTTSLCDGKGAAPCLGGSNCAWDPAAPREPRVAVFGASPGAWSPRRERCALKADSFPGLHAFPTAFEGLQRFARCFQLSMLFALLISPSLSLSNFSFLFSLLRLALGLFLCLKARDV